jgi:LPS export ABC transporter protein LptC
MLGKRKKLQRTNFIHSPYSLIHSTYYFLLTTSSFLHTTFYILLTTSYLLLIIACSFDYDIPPQENINDPDVVMHDVEYVRMEKAAPVVRLKAGQVRRYEEKHIMELDDFSFEQFNNSSPAAAAPEVNVSGTGGSARVQTDTGNLNMSGGISIEVKSEDITLNTQSLYWQDKERLLSAPGEVDITRSDGTALTGRELSADIRKRGWEFRGAVAGEMVEEEEDEEKPEASAAPDVQAGGGTAQTAQTEASAQ